MTGTDSLPFPKTIAQAVAGLEAVHEHAEQLLDPANWPGFEPDWSTGELPAPAAIEAASDDTLTRWAFARRVALVHRHPTWLIDITQLELEQWTADPAAMPLTQRMRIGAQLQLLNPPWAPLGASLFVRSQAAIERVGRALTRVMEGQFGEQETAEYFARNTEAYGKIMHRVHLTTHPDRALAALVADVRTHMRLLEAAIPRPARTRDPLSELK
jgi:hypothetical protein